MWQRFSEHARKAVFYAQEEAQRFGVNHVSTEHLLLGLLRESDSVAVLVLDKLLVDVGALRAELERNIPDLKVPPPADMTLNAESKKVIDLAYREARDSNRNYLGTEHLLLGLVDFAEGLAGKTLAAFGVDIERARKAVVEVQVEDVPLVESPATEVR